MKKLMVVMSAALLALGVSAASEVVDGVEWNYSILDGKASVYKGLWSPAIPAETVGAITIPATLGGCPVTCVGDSAFYGCSGLTSVTIPSSVTSIGSIAFAYCSGLMSVTIPVGVTSIGEEAFSYCSGLMAFVVNAGNPKYTAIDGLLCLKDGMIVVAGVNGDMAIPIGVTSIGSYAFVGCSGLKSVTIPEGVTNIGEGAFVDCSGLKSVTIPPSVTSVGSSAFSYCSGLARIDIADLEKWCGISFREPDSNPLCYAQHLYLNREEVGDLLIPTGVTSIGSYAFVGCRGLLSVTIPEGVTTIGDEAFTECSGLKSVMIPNSVTSIGEGAFSCCSGLMSVTIPTGVTSIGSYAFSGCSGLNSVTVPAGVTSIGSSAFSGCCGLKSVTIPSSVTSIGPDAFYNCSGLKSVTMPSSVTSIGECAFYGCSGLKAVEFLGLPPSGLSFSYLLSYGRAVIPRKYGAQWVVIRGINSFSGYGQGEKPVVEIVSAAIRENDPTIMDVVYKVKSAKPTVKVRVLAFQDGERSFAKVVRPTEFIEDTAKNIGDEIAANEEHKLSWRVSADWKVDLAKVKFEVLASEGDLLPLELITIPKTADHAAMEISWNAVSEQQVFDALLWMYADGDEGLVLTDGVLKRASDGYLLGYGTTVSIWNGRYSKNVTGNGSAYYYFAPAIDYVYSKMGFSVLSGDELKYANEMTRLGLSPSGVRQYAWREVEE